MNSKNKGFRIYSWGRFIVSLVILVLLAFLAGGLVFKATVSGMEEPVFDTVVVTTGDTLWDIADEYSEGKDIRTLIQEIRSINKIDSGGICPGQTIKIPVR